MIATPIPAATNEQIAADVCVSTISLRSTPCDANSASIAERDRSPRQCDTNGSWQIRGHDRLLLREPVPRGHCAHHARRHEQFAMRRRRAEAKDHEAHVAPMRDHHVEHRARRMRAE